MTNRHNRAEAATSLGVSRKTISLRFKPFFAKPFTPQKLWDIFRPKFSSTWVLGLDGKWLRRSGVVMIYRNITDNDDLWWEHWKSESYEALDTDLQNLKLGCRLNLPSGCVSDWKGSIVAKVAFWFGSIPHQRCLSHVVRDLKNLLPKSSPIQGTVELRKISISIPLVRSKDQLKAWRQWLLCWEVFYGHLLKEKSFPVHPEATKRRWWYTHGNLRRTYRILTQKQDCLFEYLNHSFVPTTNNSLEGLNSDIKIKLANHRGMKPQQQYQYLCWYFAFRKVKSVDDLKKLWDYWKKMQ